MSEESQERNRLIRKFLDQKLSREEHILFEKKIQEEDFAREVAQESVRRSSRAKLRSELKDIHQEVIVSPLRRRRVLTLGIAFGLLILLAFSYAYFSQRSSTNAPTFAAYFQPYPNVFEHRNAQLATPQSLQQALQAYDDQEYKKAIALFQPLMEEATYDGSHLPFYYALSLLADHQATAAVPLLQKMVSGSSPMLRAESRWYLALAYLQLDLRMDAQSILENIQADPSAYKAKEARQLLKLLKQE